MEAQDVMDGNKYVAGEKNVWQLSVCSSPGKITALLWLEE